LAAPARIGHFRPSFSLKRMMDGSNG
jgi:hypothetical protein